MRKRQEDILSRDYDEDRHQRLSHLLAQQQLEDERRLMEELWGEETMELDADCPSYDSCSSDIVYESMSDDEDSSPSPSSSSSNIVAIAVVAISSFAICLCAAFLSQHFRA